MQLNFEVYGEIETLSETITGYTNSDGDATIINSISAPEMWGFPVERFLNTHSEPDAGECCNILGSQYHYYTNTFTVNSNYEYRYYDCDEDDLTDSFEQELASRFKPVIHKHSYDKQQQLGNFEQSLLLSGGSTLTTANIDFGSASITIDNDSQLHSYLYNYYPFISDSYTSETAWEWVVDFPDIAQRHAGAPIGERPIYYHVYKEGNYYYLQYWLYFDMNDLRYYGQTPNQTWHEGDWEHVTIRLNSNLEPDYVNFYNHYGGRTLSASQCWWSELPVSTYALATQGWNSGSNHLNIWVAANSHAIYNRNDMVYYFKLNLGIIWMIYADNLDYSSSGYDLYFEYDKLEKMGELYKESVTHGNIIYNNHHHIKGGKHWLAYVGRVGDYWSNAVTATYSPYMPPFRINGEWKDFTINTTEFGNEEPFITGSLTIIDFFYRPDNNSLGD